MTCRILTVSTLGLVGLVGCGVQQAPVEKSSIQKSNAGKPAQKEPIQTVRLHIDGFKKSKSGAT